METKEDQRTSEATILVQIAEKLLEAQKEIDELVLQFALGKAEARDKFEETKKEFRARVAEFRKSNLGSMVSEAAEKLKGALEELELQLNLGKADSKDKFEEQRTKIEAVIDRLRAEGREFKDQVLHRENLEHEIEKFKLKLEVIRLRFELTKFEVRDSFKESMQEVRRKIEKTTAKIKDKLSPEESVLDGIRKEAQNIYKHLRKAVQSI